MNILILISLISFLGASFMFFKKLHSLEPEIAESYHGHSNFILDFFKTLRVRLRKYVNEVYLAIRPHAHDFISSIVSRLYKISSWFALEFLKFYNFIQGRKVLKNSGNASSFIRDITQNKEEGRIARKGI